MDIKYAPISLPPLSTSSASTDFIWPSNAAAASGTWTGAGTDTDLLTSFRTHLIRHEKAQATIAKYTHDVAVFLAFAGADAISRDIVLRYKQKLMSEKKPVSVNSAIASLNSFFKYIGNGSLLLNNMKTQRKVYIDNELSKEEYFKLLEHADERTKLVLETLASTGIRISELEYFTVEQVRSGRISVSCKAKTRVVMLPRALCALLLDYSQRCGIESGPILRTSGGLALNRSNVWKKLKEVCHRAGVDEEKVYPHNLRKLFAREFYRVNGDISKLADVLGHSNINTTRIYIMSSGDEHQAIIDGLGMVPPAPGLSTPTASDDRAG